MAKLIYHYITAVKFANPTEREGITELLVHEVWDDHKVKKGEVVSEAEVLQLIAKNEIFYTARWNYNSPSWTKGARVEAFKIGGKTVLRTHPDSQVNDNLSHMLVIGNIR